MRKPVIAIDGYSSTGKSSISKVIAKKLGLVHMDTGALYRGVTYFANTHYSDHNGEPDLEQLVKNLGKIKLEFRKEHDDLVLYLNGEDVSKAIRTNEVSQNVSLVAAKKEVRDFLMETQRSIADKGGVIMDGRDIGTVVLPHADFKFFLTASTDERAKRRFLELKGLGIETDIDTVRNNLLTRDKIDSERDVAPLKKADDAILIDNTTLDKNQTIELILSYLKDF